MIFFDLIDDDIQRSKFLEIYDHYRYTIFYIACGILSDRKLAEDAVQEAFLTIAKNIKRFDNFEIDQARNLIYLIAKHAAIDIYRKRKKNKKLLLENYFEMNINDISFESEVLEDIQINEIRKIILNMPDIYRDVLELNLIHELSQKEIASLLHLSYENVKKRVQRGKKILIKELGNIRYE